MNINILVIFVVMIHGTMQLDYECDFHGSIDITNPDKTKFKTFDLRKGNDNADCRGDFTEDYSHVLLRNCTVGKHLTILFLTRRFGILMLGNFAGPFSVQCHDIPTNDVLAVIVSNFLLGNNIPVPTDLKEILNGSTIVTKMRHISQTSVYSNDLTFQWVLNTTVLLQLLEQQENANGSTTLGPAETTHPPGPTIEIVENSTTQSSATTSAEIPSDNIVTAESNTFTESTIGPLPTISPIGDDTSNVTSATTNQTTNEQTPTILEIMSSDEASPTSTKSPTDNKASDTSTTVV
ncbi:uncharacterized protein LOC132755328 isoform X1 [Ruditapes philippinarum]|uniref:uncharacterized protein LOC132755328 isoform X1 n=1 Tax=Ruditapes philippinarum TaxID=129788 RepID=UPI00295AE117|nr:uncharacterized protein LOC132755328 isoform X1 [Ruditapes philippinarum]